VSNGNTKTTRSSTAKLKTSYSLTACQTNALDPCRKGRDLTTKCQLPVGAIPLTLQLIKASTYRESGLRDSKLSKTLVPLLSPTKNLSGE